MAVSDSDSDSKADTSGGAVLRTGRSSLYAKLPKEPRYNKRARGPQARARRELLADPDASRGTIADRACCSLSVVSIARGKLAAEGAMAPWHHGRPALRASAREKAQI